MNFTEFFRAVWSLDPFPWQVRLANLVLGGHWPSSIGLPTASGKTALIDIAIYALAMRAPNSARRIFFVVDRRIVVDEAAERAEKLLEKLQNADASTELGKIAETLRAISGTAFPLKAAVLRGGIARDDSWTDSPRQPVVVCSTVDQLGSSLLFRAYGTNEYQWPIRASLAAHDSLIILDEAHISQPFAETLERIRSYRGWAEQPLATPMTVVEMSATPRSINVFREDDDDYRNQILRKRWEAEKRTRLVVEDSGDDATAGASGPSILAKRLAREARAMRDQHGAKVIGVIANRVGTARQAREELASDDGSTAILLTGRARPFDRDRLWNAWRHSIGLGRAEQPESPVFVVATQCIEVGANIDFDALVTEIASLDALEQRFGRLNRDGREGTSHAAIVAHKEQTSAKYDDRIYGRALASSWAWLREHLTKEERTVSIPSEGKKKPRTKKEKAEFVQMGVLSFRRALAETSNRQALVVERQHAPVLMPAHVDLLCQTSPAPLPSPDPALFLHGPQTEPADVQIVWRQDLDESQQGLWRDTVATCPPSSAESISLPVWAVQKWIGREAIPDLADVEGTPAEESRVRGGNTAVLGWRGPDESSVLGRIEEVRPGMVLVLPTSYGGCDEWGWNPMYQGEIKDVGDPVKLAMGRPLLRLDRKLAEQWKYSELASRLRTCEQSKFRELLNGFESSDVEPWVKEAVQALAGSRNLKAIDNPDDEVEQIAAISGLGTFSQEGIGSAYTVQTPLDKHLDGCKKWASLFAEGLSEKLRATVVKAAALHDIGKADPRFQAWLRGGNPVKPTELIAKSGKSGLNLAAINRARQLAGYPKGGRHELLSVALLASSFSYATDLDSELLLHLIGSHHGRCRPFAPVVADREPVQARYNGWSASTDHGLASVGSGISDRFWILIRRYGWYGLAYLETLVRLADSRCSEEEETQASQKKEIADA